jgi:TRAP-type C4-dicarboxylate transport system substrate-binding protein
MKWSNKPRVLAVMVVAALVLAACGGGDDVDDGDAVDDTADEMDDGDEADEADDEGEADDGGDEAAADLPDEPFELRMAHCVPETHIYHRAAVYFGDLIEERTDGLVTARYFPNCELGDEVSLFDLHTTGDVDITVQYVASGGSVVPELGYLSIPFLFDSEEHWVDVMLDRDTMAYWKQIIDDGGYDFTMGAVGSFGTRSIYSKSVVPQTIDDFAGLKMRVTQSPSMVETWEAIGVDPIGLPFPELYSALEAGIVDAADNSPVGYTLLSHQEVAPEYIRTNHEAATGFFFVRNEIYDSLSPELREIWDEAMWETSQFWVEGSQSDNAEIETQFDDLGVTQHEVSAEFLADIQAAAEPIRVEYSEQWGMDEFDALIEERR